VIFFCFAFNQAYCNAQQEGPVFGRPRYEVIDEREWMFIVHEFEIDWYATTSQIEWTDNGFKLFIRAVKPTSINYGPLQINCNERKASAYYEPYAVIDLARDGLVARLFRGNCLSTGRR